MMDEKDKQVNDILKKFQVIFKAVQAHSKLVEEKCGLSSAKLWMLYEIGQNPGLKVSQLAAVLAIHPSTCSNMLDKLEENQLIYRDRSKTDQRAVHLFLTEMGTELLAKAPEPAHGKLTDALVKLNSSQLKGLHTGLENLFKAW
jgi:DNA-binding MarR family transcriptional regulator